MIRFDFLHDAPFGPFDLMRSVRVPRALKTPVAVLLTLSIVVSLWATLEHVWIAQARAEDLAATARFEQSRDALERTRLERTDVDRLIAIDHRIRIIRASGVLVANRLAELANEVPDRAWLSGIRSEGSKTTIDGYALDFATLGDALAGLSPRAAGSSLQLIRASKDEQRLVPAISFEVRMDQPS